MPKCTQRSVVLACARVSASERCLVDDQIIFRRQERGNCEDAFGLFTTFSADIPDVGS